MPSGTMLLATGPDELNFRGTLFGELKLPDELPGITALRENCRAEPVLRKTLPAFAPPPGVAKLRELWPGVPKLRDELFGEMFRERPEDGFEREKLLGELKFRGKLPGAGVLREKLLGELKLREKLPGELKLREKLLPPPKLRDIPLGRLKLCDMPPPRDMLPPPPRDFPPPPFCA